MFAFLIGCFVGCAFGVLIIGLLNIARDERDERRK
jgi:hypothetical protein